MAYFEISAHLQRKNVKTYYITCLNYNSWLSLNVKLSSCVHICVRHIKSQTFMRLPYGNEVIRHIVLSSGSPREAWFVAVGWQTRVTRFQLVTFTVSLGVAELRLSFSCIPVTGDEGTASAASGWPACLGRPAVLTVAYALLHKNVPVGKIYFGLKIYPCISRHWMRYKILDPNSA